METQNTPLLSEIAAFCARHDLSKSAFGEAALGDPRLVFDLEKGRELRSRTLARLKAYLASGESVLDGSAA